MEAFADTTMVYLDDLYVGSFDAVGSGTVGLVTSMSTVAFDNFSVEPA